MAPLAPQPAALSRATGRFAALLTSQRMTLPSSGLAGRPAAAGCPNDAALDGADRPVRIAAAVQPQVVADDDRRGIRLRRDQWLPRPPRRPGRPSCRSNDFQVVVDRAVGVASADQQQPVRGDRGGGGGAWLRQREVRLLLPRGELAGDGIGGQLKTVVVGAPVSSRAADDVDAPGDVGHARVGARRGQRRPVGPGVEVAGARRSGRRTPWTGPSSRPSRRRTGGSSRPG